MASVFETKAPSIMRALMRDFALDLESAAAILGNLGHESGGFRFLQEKQPLIPGSAGGYGWAQWTGPRRRQYEAYCKRNSLDPAGDKANYGFLFVELMTTEAKAIPAVKAAIGLSAKVRAFELAFERAGVKHYPSRESWANRALQAYRTETQATKAPTADAGKIGGGAAAGGAVVVGTATAVEAGWSFGEIAMLILGMLALAGLAYAAWRWWQARKPTPSEIAGDAAVAALDAAQPLSKADTAIADDLAAGIATAAKARVAVVNASAKPRRKPKKAAVVKRRAAAKKRRA